MAAKKKNTVKRYRDAKTGRLLTDAAGKKKKPSEVVRESIPVPGRGDT